MQTHSLTTEKTTEIALEKRYLESFKRPVKIRFYETTALSVVRSYYDTWRYVLLTVGAYSSPSPWGPSKAPLEPEEKRRQ